MSLVRAVTNTRILETVENYARVEVETGRHPPYGRSVALGSDEEFWAQVFDGYLKFGTSVDFPQRVAVSEWTARVPGLFWTPAAAKLRIFSDHHVERIARDSTILKPFGKSRLVSGGVGTMRLPPAASGDRLVTIVTSGNASAGIPALVTDDVWRAHHLSEGAIIVIRGARWEPMEEDWASRFPSTRSVPRGYLRLNGPQTIDSHQQNVAIEIHPFSIMEYAADNAVLFDFVFATATTDPRGAHRAEVETFFDQYKRAQGRNGRYLIAADLAEPLWDSEFTSPEQLRRSHPGAPSHLRVLQRRIEDSMENKDTTEYLLRVLTGTDLDLLRRFSADAGIPHQRWFSGGSLAEESAHLIAHLPPDKVPVLIDAIGAVNPNYLET